MSKYFHVKIEKCVDRSYVIDTRSDEQCIIVKSSRHFYSITTDFFDKLIEPSNCLNFNYIKYKYTSKCIYYYDRSIISEFIKLNKKYYFLI